MKKLSFVLAACAVLFSFNANADINGNVMQFGTDDIKSGSHCQIKKTVLLSKSADDCAKAGGKVVTPAATK